MRVPANRPIAVLLSGLTASSGEIVAVSLQGRPATRFLGKPTYGATTANTSYQIRGTSYLTVAGSVDADRQGHSYPIHLQPDEIIMGGDNFADFQQDTKVLAALNWLKTAKAGRSKNADSGRKSH